MSDTTTLDVAATTVIGDGEWGPVRRLHSHSAWPPVFFEYKGELWVAISDSDRWELNLQKYSLLDAYPNDTVTVGGAPQMHVEPYESVAVATGEDTILIAYHEHGNNNLFIVQGYGELNENTHWTRMSVKNARIKDLTSPAMVTLGSDVVLTWADYGDNMPGSGDRDGLYVMYYDLKKPGWTQPEKIPGRDSQNSPTLCVTKNGAAMAWAGYHGGTPIYTGFLPMGSRTWSPQFELSKDISTDKGPALTVQGDQLFLFWRDNGTIKCATGYSHTGFGSIEQIKLEGGVDSNQDVRAYTTGDTTYLSWEDGWVMKYAIRRPR